ncbi:MAG: chloride channel protein [Ilumatobacteraceae bacterium]
MWRRDLNLGLGADALQARRAELRQLVRRSREVVVLAAITGAVTGLMVRGFEYVVIEVLFDRVVSAEHLWMSALAPAAGLVVAAIILRYIGGRASPATTDDYLRAFHDPAYPLRTRHFVGRIMASIATLGSGGALGMEGPSLYGGSAIGAMIQRRLPRPFRGSDHRTLMVAGAAAGVAAIFKAPATGAIFALEVPYRDDLARRMLLPALVAAATGYLTFVALSDTSPIFGVIPVPPFSLRDLLGAVAIGVTCAVGARGFAKALRVAKGYSSRPLAGRLVVCAAALAGLFAASRVLTGESLSIGPGYDLIRVWLVEDDHGFWLLVAIFAVRCLASAFTLAGGGVGGLFVPLVVGGAVVGRGVAEVIHPERGVLYSLLGIAAFLGAGYRVPLAAVMFVAETTGRPNFVVPALFAAVAAELVMGEQSVTSFQRRPGQD